LYYIKTVFTPLLELATNNIDSHLIIYPNPVSSILNIDYNSDIESIAIYSITGTLVKEIKGKVTSIELSNLSNGSYFITIQSNKGVINKRFIKQ
jgi:hypothetical protein